MLKYLAYQRVNFKRWINTGFKFYVYGVGKLKIIVLHCLRVQRMFTREITIIKLFKVTNIFTHLVINLKHAQCPLYQRSIAQQ